MNYFRYLFFLPLLFLAACAAIDVPDQPSFDSATPKASTLSFQEELEMAQAYDQHGLFDKAYESYKAALAMDPDNITVLAGLVRNASNLTRYDEAETYCQKVLKLEPNEAEMLYYQAWLDVKLRKDYAAAHAAIDRAIAVSFEKKPYFMQTKGLFFVDEKRDEEAVAIFRAALAEADKAQLPDKARALLKLDLYKNLGRACRRLGREDEAKEALTKAFGLANGLSIPFSPD